MQVGDLQTNQHVDAFYEGRYARGYMADWDAFKRARIRRMIRALPLAKEGMALDYGCGQGVFTNDIREALPGWTVYGCDISTTAIDMARSRFPGCQFHLSDDAGLRSLTFDLVFSHHVLEHVLDLDATIATLHQFASARAFQFHLLPCGNEGSFEHDLARMRVNGIQADYGNRFFHEDEGHLRRLTSRELTDLFGKHGYELFGARYSGHLIEALNWMRKYPRSYLTDLADPMKARTPMDAKRLRHIQQRLLRLWHIEHLSQQDIEPLMMDLKRGDRHSLKAMAKLSMLPAFKLLSILIEGMARLEWRVKSRNPGGSQMFLIFARAGTIV